jgi:transcriptional regulator with XRE-family HTH domain
MVPINLAALQWAQGQLHLTTSQIAGRVGVPQQTIDAILRAKPGRRVRSSLRRKLARAIGVADSMLTDAPDQIHLPAVVSDTEFQVSPATRFVASRLATLTAQAVTRDLALPGVEAPATAWEADFVVQSTQTAVVRLLEIARVRSRWLCFTAEAWTSREGVEPPRTGGKPSAGDTSEHEAAVLALARIVEHVLQPWFDGVATLDYRALRKDGVLWLPTPAHPPLGTAPPNPFAILPGTLKAPQKPTVSPRAKRRRKS